MTTSDSVNFKDFKKKRRDIYFTNGPDERYDCVPALSLPAIQDIAKLSEGFTIETAVDHFVEFFNTVLVEESAQRFEHKMRTDKIDPIDQEQALDMMLWVLEQYGVRPTQPSSGTSDSSPTDDGGTSSEVGASPEE